MSVEIALILTHTAVLLITFIVALRQIYTKKSAINLVFFAFAVASALFSDFYWITYDIMRPGTRMPFAANEIGEWAMFLLVGEALIAKNKYIVSKACIICTISFAAANTALWIAWTGEWIQDIFTGMTLGYFLYRLSVCINDSGAFPAWEWKLLCIACPLLIGAQTATFFVPEAMLRSFDLFGYMILMTIGLILIIRAIIILKGCNDPAVVVSSVFTAFAWSVITMYMSSGGFYIVAMLSTMICFPMMFISLKKEAEMS
ncbi:hypothetical protein SAMN04487934_101512 [Eubacterium ruminantium]|nr:hypothetical protein SAMN04487934_101512 [Eubacterium ruminantium]